MTPKYPYAEIEPHQTKKNIVCFHLHLQQGAMVCIPLQGDRTIIRRILNPHYMKSVIIYQQSVKVTSGLYEEIERLEYYNNTLIYHNQHTIWKIPFQDNNRKSLMEYDFQLEERGLNGFCCTLY